MALPPARVCSLFAGVGGLDLGLELAFGSHAVVYVEREAFAAAALVARMEEEALAQAPIWDDVCTFDGLPWRGSVDCVAGGSPCQDLSVAGKRAGLDGDRSGLFWQQVRIVEEIQPRWVVWENVAGAAGVLPRVCEAFETLGYRGAVVKVRASDVGAPHERARFFLLAHRIGDEGWQSERGGGGPSGAGAPEPRLARIEVANADTDWRSQPSRREPELGRRVGYGGASMADTDCSRRERRWCECGRDEAGPGSLSRPEGSGVDVANTQSQRRSGRWRCCIGTETQLARPALCHEFPPGPGDEAGWARWVGAQPGVRGGADGLASGLDATAYRLDRLRALGNGVVPQQAAAALGFLYEYLTT